MNLTHLELQLAIESVMVCRVDLERRKDKFEGPQLRRLYHERMAALVALYDKLSTERTSRQQAA